MYRNELQIGIVRHFADVNSRGTRGQKTRNKQLAPRTWRTPTFTTSRHRTVYLFAMTVNDTPMLCHLDVIPLRAPAADLEQWSQTGALGVRVVPPTFRSSGLGLLRTRYRLCTAGPWRGLLTEPSQATRGTYDKFTVLASPPCCFAPDSQTLNSTHELMSATALG